MFRFRLVEVLRFRSNALFCHLFWTFSETFVIENEVSEGKHTSRKATRQRNKNACLDLTVYHSMDRNTARIFSCLANDIWCFFLLVEWWCVATHQQRSNNKEIDIVHWIRNRRVTKMCFVSRFLGTIVFFSSISPAHTHTSRRMMGENTITLISAHLLYTHTQR